MKSLIESVKRLWRLTVGERKPKVAHNLDVLFRRHGDVGEIYKGKMFDEPMPYVLFHLRQIMDGTRTNVQEHYLGILFSNCDTMADCVVTAEYYLKIFEEESPTSLMLVAFCSQWPRVIKSMNSKSDLEELRNEGYFYAKPSRAPSEAIKIPIEVMQEIHLSGDPAACPEFFVFCNTRLDCYYTAAWYLTVYDNVPNEKVIDMDEIFTLPLVK